jgi:hypothetical protein
MKKPDGRNRLRDAIGIAFVLLLAFAAFDDITTDNDTDFRVEYAALAASGLFLSVASVRLLRSGHRKLGGVSLVALAGAFWAQGSIGLAPGFWPAYVAMAAAFLWFGVLAMVLFIRAHEV